MNLRKDIHILSNLVTFEVVSRSANFTRAAETLGITRVAVSRQIAELEASLGQTLFLRGQKKVQMTVAGETLARQVGPALAAIAEAIAQQRAGDSAARLTITATSAFATYWLMPRLADFSALHPDVIINLVVSDRYLDLASEGIDIALRYFEELPSEAGWTPLIQEEIFPVYSPRYRAATALSKPEDLLAERLINLTGTYRQKAQWGYWLRAHGLSQAEEARGITSNTYVNMLQAAIDGQGIALAGYPLVDAYLANGTLRVIDGIEPFKRGFYCVSRPNATLPSAVAFVSWVIEQCRVRGARDYVAGF